MTEETLKELVDALEGKPGDLLLFAADKNKVVWDVLGALRLEIAKNLGLLNKDEYKFLWITEFPSWNTLRSRGALWPCIIRLPCPWRRIWTSWIQILGLFAPRLMTSPSMEMRSGGGSVRIFQNDVQSKMFEVLGFTKEQAQERFGFLLNAFKYGVPPHAGLAYGLDRLIMLMAKEDSIREVIAFPKVKDASCLMTGAPGPVDQEQLNELELAIEVQEEELAQE